MKALKNKTEGSSENNNKSSNVSRFGEVATVRQCHEANSSVNSRKFAIIGSGASGKMFRKPNEVVEGSYCYGCNDTV